MLFILFPGVFLHFAPYIFKAGFLSNAKKKFILNARSNIEHKMTVFYIIFFLKSCYHIPINALETVNLRRNGFLDSPMELPGGF